MQHPEFKRAEEIAEGLFTHQIEGIAFLLGRRRALLADDMGLGKTRQSIIAMVEAEPVGPYLVICHASIKRNWAREIEIVLPNTEPAIAGPKPLPSTDFQDWVIINYEILGKNLDKLLEFDWKGVVFDEAHYLKNYQSQRSQNGAKLVQSIENNPIVHALTGTPMTSRPRDLFPILQLVDHPLEKVSSVLQNDIVMRIREISDWSQMGQAILRNSPCNYTVSCCAEQKTRCYTRLTGFVARGPRASQG